MDTMPTTQGHRHESDPYNQPSRSAWGHDGWRDLAQMGSAQGIGAPAAASPPPTKPAREGRPRAIVVAQSDAVGGPEGRVSPPEDQYVAPPPRRRPPSRYYGPPPYRPPVYGPPPIAPGFIELPGGRIAPCALMIVGLSVCI